MKNFLSGKSGIDASMPRFDVGLLSSDFYQGGISALAAAPAEPNSAQVAFAPVTSATAAANQAPLFSAPAFAITRVSTDSNGAQSDSGITANLSFSHDGTKIAFYSAATNLVSGDTNGYVDIFIKDLASGVVTRIDTDAAGNQATDGDSQTPIFSPDGTMMLFSSSATNLVAGDTNNLSDIFLKDLATGAISLVSTDAGGTQAVGGDSFALGFAPDGKILFSSAATNLVAGDTNNVTDLFLKDMTTGAITRLSTDSAGNQGNNSSSQGVLSPDGTKLLFSSDASNLVAGDTNSTPDLFLKDLATGVTTRISTDSNGAQATGPSTNARFSPDGTKVLFASAANNLVAGDTNGYYDLFIKDLATGAVTRVNTDSNGAQATNGATLSGYFSPDGTKIVFDSIANNLVAGDTNGRQDTFVKDLISGVTTRVSISATGAQPTVGSSDTSGFSPDGSKVLIASGAANLVAGDTNNARDLFVATLGNVGTGASYVETGPAARIAPFVSLSDDGTSFAGGTLTIALTAGVVAGDTLSLGSGVTVANGNVSYNGTVVGVLTATATSLSIALNANASVLAVQEIAEAAQFSVTSVAPGNGTRTATFTLVDGGGTANGGHDTTSFTRSIAVTAVNTPPSGTDVTFNQLEDGGAHVFTQSDFGFSDGDGNAFAGVKMTTVPVRGILTDNGVPVIGGQIIPLADIVAGKLVYTPSADLNGTIAFTFQVQDDGGTANGGLDTDQSPNSITFNITAVNDAPHFAVPTFAQARVSVDAAGGQANGIATTPIFSPDGTKVAFANTASNLVAGDGNGVAADIFLKDLTTGAITLVSTNAAGVQGNNSSTVPSFSTDGTKMAFVSASSNLVSGVSGTQVYVKDLTTGVVTLVSASASGVVGAGTSLTSVISADGSKVAFYSNASNLVTGDTNAQVDLFVKNLLTGAITRVSTDSSGNQATGGASSGSLAFSPDGSKIAFTSNATNLVVGDTNNLIDIFVKDLDSGVTTRVSTTAAGAQAIVGSSSAPIFSPDGTKVMFASSATNLVAGDTNNATDIFIKDLTSGAITRVSTDSSGAQATGGASTTAAFSPDGTKIVFVSAATNLVANDTNGVADVFVKDLITGAVTRISVASDGTQGGGGGTPMFSPDGTKVTFTSGVNNLVSGDTNNNIDAFVATLGVIGAVPTPNYVENAAPVAIVPLVSVTDDSASFAGGSLSVALGAGSAAGDVLSLVGQGVTVAAGMVSYNGTEIGTLSGGGTSLVIAFTSAATAAAVQAVALAVSFATNGDNPDSAPRTATFTLVDGGGTANGGHDTTVLTQTIAVTPVNDAPLVDLNGSASGIDNEITYQVPAPHQISILPIIAGAATVADVDSADFNGGILTVSFHADPNQTTFSQASDQLIIFDESFAGADHVAVSGNTLSYNGVQFATFTGGTDGTDLIVTLGAAANAANMQALIEQIYYESTSSTPQTTDRKIGVTLTDGDGGTSALATTTLHVVAAPVQADAAPVAVADTATTAGNAIATINVVGNDTDTDGGPKAVAAINGTTVAVGGHVTLASGAIVTLNGDGTLGYDPHGAFDYINAQSSTVDHFSYTLNGGSSADVAVTVTGTDSASNANHGSAGNDVVVGSGSFDVSQGGDDVVTGGAGNDAFFFGAAFTGADRVDGGGGTNDQIGLQGDYTGAHALVLGANTISNIEVITGLAGFSYDIKTNDGNVAAGGTLKFYGSTLGVGDSFTVDGSAETDGKFIMYGGLGADHFTGGAGDDGFYFGRDGRFNVALDHIDGGAGNNDQLGLEGDYTVTISNSVVTNVEVISLLDGLATHSQYHITLTDDWTAAGQTHTVYGVPVRDGFTLDASAETDGNIKVYGGLGNDTITTGAGSDWISGGAGADTLDGGLGADMFFYNKVSDSIGTSHDTILNFDALVDHIRLPTAVTGIDTAIDHGALNTATFDADLTMALAGLTASHAVQFTADSGSLAGHIFEVIDTNGIAGYQAGQDMVIELQNPVNPINDMSTFV